ncbi:hypothetical protein LSAT2_028658 [Lamellibrachia satsuma]|nr:hypothetical protein LSAT2_028658 [Lamellibrachia satsuma]
MEATDMSGEQIVCTELHFQASHVSAQMRQFGRMRLFAIHLVAALVMSTVSTSSELSEDFKVERFNDLGRESGRARQCNGSKQNFTIEWSPKKVVLDGPLQISFTVTPLMDHTEGKTCVTAYLEQSVLYNRCSSSSFHCGEINTYFPNMCPFRKGVISKGTVEIDMKKLPLHPAPGNYKVVIKLLGLDGKEFLCAVLQVPIVSCAHGQEDYDYGDCNYD